MILELKLKDGKKVVFGGNFSFAVSKEKRLFVTSGTLFVDYTLEDYPTYNVGGSIVSCKEATSDCTEEVPNQKAAEFRHAMGLEAGRPKWHKVADGDLPEPGVEVLDENGDKVRYELEGYAGDSGQFPSLSGWIAFSEYEERDVEVDAPIAWCEVPQYTEETIE